MSLTPEQLRAIVPGLLFAPAERVVSALLPALEAFELTSPVRLAAFLSQCAHESQGFTKTQENLMYSATRLMQVWPKHFPTLMAAQRYSGHPAMIANRAYALRNGNGTEASGDGWKYRGRGYIQLTGKAQYKRCGEALALDLLAHPELLELPGGAAQSACWYWADRGCSDLADENTERNFALITRIINGAERGLAERTAYWTRAKAVLGVG